MHDKRTKKVMLSWKYCIDTIKTLTQNIEFKSHIFYGKILNCSLVGCKLQNAETRNIAFNILLSVKNELASVDALL